MSNLPLAPRLGNITGKPLTTTVHWLCKDLTSYNPSAVTLSEAVGHLEYHYVLSLPWVRVCLDLAVRPTGKVKYLLCCVFSCKGAGTELICKFNIRQQLAVCQWQVPIVYTPFTIQGDIPPMMDFISKACSSSKTLHTSTSSSRWRTVSQRCCNRLESRMNMPPPAPILVSIGYSNSSTRISLRMVWKLTSNSKARFPTASLWRS